LFSSLTSQKTLKQAFKEESNRSLLLEETADDQGNLLVYEYKAGNEELVDSRDPAEQNRLSAKSATGRAWATAGSERRLSWVGCPSSIHQINSTLVTFD
jgi:hypothetical protein